jgi:hypothetical protein
MREDLLGYLLGALDSAEQQRIESRLAEDPQLRREFYRLKRCLEPLDALDQEYEPPSGLADRVCQNVEKHAEQARPVPGSVAARPHESSFRRSQWSMADGIVVALVCLMAITLFMPALANSRFLSEKIVCQNNLRSLGAALVGYSERQPDRTFPFVPLEGNQAFAGVYAPKLLESQLIAAKEMALVCPSSELALNSTNWNVPTLDEIDRASRLELVKLQQVAGGSYAYNIGYVEDLTYRPVENQGRTHFALLGDAPSYHLPGRRSANHGGRGQNILFEDGHILFVGDPHLLRGDDPLRNRAGYLEAGQDCNDAVVAPSAERPIADPTMIEIIHPLAERQSTK